MTIITTHPAALSSHCFPNPCKNEGLCAEVKNKEGYMCVCKEGFVGTNCESKNCLKTIFYKINPNHGGKMFNESDVQTGKVRHIG